MDVRVSSKLKDIDYQLIRCHRRKRIALQVKQQKIIVKAPYNVPEDYIEQLVWQKRQWITDVQEKQSVALSNQNIIDKRGQLWLYGRLTSLDVCIAHSTDILLQENKLTVFLKEQDFYRPEYVTKVKKQLELWFKCQATDLLMAKLAQLSQLTGLVPSSVTVRQYKARWGCCDNRGNVKLNYFLLMTPEWVMEYVIVHELCHLIHLNHSKDFWQLVSEHCPNYLQAEKWLKEHQSLLTWP